jgi:hypothetical protein
MGRIQTELKGITTASAYEDGDMYSLVNLRRKGGVLQPVLPYGSAGSVPAGLDEIFIHRNEDWEHWIGFAVSPADPVLTQVMWFEPEGGVVETVVTDLQDRINSVEQTGNMLVFISDTAMYYALFKDGHYKWYGELPDMVPVEWTCYEEKEYYENNTGDEADKGRPLDIQTLGIIADSRYATHGGNVVNPWDNYTYAYIYNKPAVEEDFVSLRESIKGTINETRLKLSGYYAGTGGVDAGNLFRGLFYDAFFARYAYRLYDDTHVKLSPPVLVMPASRLLDNVTVRSSWRFVPKEASDQVDIGFQASLSRMFVRGYVPGVKYDLSSLSGYEEIIKGVDIFLSPMLNIAGSDKTGDLRALFPFVFPGSIDIGAPLSESVTASVFDKPDMGSIADMSLFGLVKSLDTGATTNGNYIPFPEKTDSDTISNITNVLHREQLKDSTQSAHKSGAKKTYSYNGMLHLADITTSFFKGFGYPFFNWQSPDNYGYNGGPARTYSDPYFSSGDEIIIETEIKTGSSFGKVYAVYAVTDYSYGVLSAMLSYPDTGAKRMTFYRKDGGDGRVYRVRTFELLEHEFLNVAYYLNEDLKPVVIPVFGVEAPAPDTSRGFTFVAHNELRVSETNNPLRVTNENVMTVGTGRIMAMGSNMMSVSNWNYGVFPLYVFTTEGIYTLKVGEGGVAYSKVTQPTSLDIPVSDVVCSTPHGVVFVAQRGLMFINGQRLDYLTGGVEERPDRLHLQEFAGVTDRLYGAGMAEGFTDYIKGVTSLAYGSRYNEVIVSDASKGYSWALSLDDGAMCRTTNRTGKAVRNAAPASYVFCDGTLFDIDSETGEADVAMITRPLRYGTPDVKRLERIIVRGLLYGLKGAEGYAPVTGLLYSNDGRNFLFARGLRIKEGNHRDLDMGMLGRQQFREYVLVFAGRVSEGTKIEFVESEVVKAYDNTKMR